MKHMALVLLSSGILCSSLAECGVLDNVSWGNTCDMTLMSLDVENGSVKIELNRNGNISQYPDVIHDTDPMFVYSLYNSGTQGFSIKPASGSTSYATAFFYCFTNGGGGALSLYDAEYNYNVPVSGGGSTPPPTDTRPNSGSWSGNIMKFTVLSDRAHVNNVKVGPMKVTNVGSCSSVTTTVTTSSPSGFAITNRKFGFSGSSMTVAGTFSSATSSSGTYNYSKYNSNCGAQVNKSGSWTANASLSKAQSKGYLPDFVEYRDNEELDGFSEKIEYWFK